MTPPLDDEFCSPFDAALARSGVGAVFLLDREGLLRFDAEWTRDGWGRRSDPSAAASWALARDRASGHVQMLWLSRSDLVDDHPRVQVRTFPDRATAQEFHRSVGLVAEAGW